MTCRFKPDPRQGGRGIYRNDDALPHVIEAVAIRIETFDSSILPAACFIEPVLSRLPAAALLSPCVVCLSVVYS